MFTHIFWRFLILETLVIGAMSKICENRHIQYRYCTNEFALKASLLRNKDNMGRYKTRILELYKGDASKLHLDAQNRTRIVLDSNLTFAHGSKYAVYGLAKNGSLHVKTCNGIRAWRFMTRFQEVAMTDEYTTTCNCIVQIGKFSPNKVCLWRASYMKWSAGKCIWVTTNPFKTCRNEYAHLLDNYK